MNILTGYLSATAGTARIDGVDVLGKAARRQVEDRLFARAAAAVYGYDGQGIPQLRLRAEKLPPPARAAHQGNLRGRPHRRRVRRIIKNLSKGYRQRVASRRRSSATRRVLIFDEPTVGLDPKQIIEIRNLIKLLGKEHTVILSTHILPEVQAVCDRIVVIDKGVIVANEKTEDLINAVEGSAPADRQDCRPRGRGAENAARDPRRQIRRAARPARHRLVQLYARVGG